MWNDQPAFHTLFACEWGLSEPEIGLEHTFRFVPLIWQKKHVKWQNLHGPHLQTGLILSVTFIWVPCESASTAFDYWLRKGKLIACHWKQWWWNFIVCSTCICLFSKQTWMHLLYVCLIDWLYKSFVAKIGWRKCNFLEIKAPKKARETTSRWK
jgi:hypothetical protein